MGQRFVVLVGCIAAVLVTAFPAVANNEPTMGTRIGLFQPPATFAANSPFYVEQGFACELGDSSCIAPQISASATFDLYLDGAPRGCGGIGRRARFRSVWASARGGSSPLVRMTVEE